MSAADFDAFGFTFMRVRERSNVSSITEVPQSELLNTQSMMTSIVFTILSYICLFKGPLMCKIWLALSLSS